jgi:filamin
LKVYGVTFTPTARGKHRVYVYLNGMEVKGSPFSLRIGKDMKETRASKTEAFKVRSSALVSTIGVHFMV